MQLLIFDDSRTSDFYPLALTRPVFELRSGILKLRQRLEAHLGAKEDSLLCMENRLQKLYQQRHPDWKINHKPTGDCLYLNSRIKLNEASLKAIKAMKKESCLISQNQVIAARTAELPIRANDISPISIEDALTRKYQSQLHSDFITSSNQAAKNASIGLYSSLADLIHDNARLIEWDFSCFFDDKENYFETEPGVTVLHPYNIWLSEGVQLSPGVVLDASEGPIVIDEATRVMPNAVICGPSYIGKHSLIKIGAKLYGGTSIGKTCKVGGEVEGSIFQAYANKQHDGFLGHAYIGEWVNLGADTNNSDLKNTYKTVSYYSYSKKAKLDSGSQFLGCLIGDHSKTGINCSINTGAVIGTGCNLWGRNLISDFIPDFSWGEAGQLIKYRFSAFCETAEIVKQRRKLSFSLPEQELYRELHSMET